MAFPSERCGHSKINLPTIKCQPKHHRPAQQITYHQSHPKQEGKRPHLDPAYFIIVSDLVYLFSDHNKTRACDRYLVVKVTSSFCNIRKFIGSQLRSTSYCTKASNCCSVPSKVTDFRPSIVNSDTDLSSFKALPAQPIPSPHSSPVISSAILLLGMFLM